MRIEVEVFKEVDGVDMVVCFFEVELLCGKRHRGLHGSHNSPTFHWVTCCKYSSFCLFCKAPGEELHLQWAFAGTSRLCVSLSICSRTAAEQYSRHSFSLENERLPCFVS